MAAVAAGGFAVIAVVATLLEMRRSKRKQIDQVGWMPWTTIAVASFFAAMALFMLAMKSWLGG